MRRRRNHVGVRNGALVASGDHQPGEMGNIADVIGIHFSGDLPEDLEVDLTRVRRRPGDDDLRPVLLCQFPDPVVVHPPGRRIHAVLHALEKLAGGAHLPPVREMPAFGERQPHDRLPRLDQRVVRRQIGHRPRIRLDIGVIGAEDLLRPVDRQGLDQVRDLLPLVVAFVRVPLGVFVGETAPRRQHHRLGDVVLRGDQAYLAALPGLLLPYEFIDEWIVLFEC